MEFKHCHIFSSQTEYEAFVNSPEYKEPFLGFTPDRDKSYTNLIEGLTLGAYNNYGTALTCSVVDIGETYMGQRVRRWSFTPKTSTVVSSLKNNYGNHGVHTPSIYIDEKSGTRKSVYWIYYRPHTSGLTAGGNASNIGNWGQIPMEDMGDGWYRVGQYRTNNPNTSKTSDFIFTSINWKYAELNKTCVIDFVDAGYYVSGTTAIPETTRVDYSTDIEEEMLETPLSFDIVTGGVIILTVSSSAISRTIQYCKNDGPYSSATVTNTAPHTINVVKGDTLRFKGDNNTYSNGSGYFHFGKRTTTAQFNVYGNIMSLITSTAFKDKKNFSAARVFQFMFQLMPGVLSCANLLLPASDLSNYCYYCMFDSCTNLKKAPKIIKADSTGDYGLAYMFYGCNQLEESPILDISTITAYGCYEMFRNCSKLNKITCLCDTTSSNNPLTSWVNGVQTKSGTFIKKAGVELTSGIHGIPSNWTIVEV